MNDIDMKAANSVPAGAEELFRIISRFEFALKEMGFAKPGRNGEADLCWDNFANECLGQDFFQNIKDSKIAPTLLNQPPSVQVIANRSLSWKDGTPPKSVQELLGAVRRVRNNLFHGGKSGDRDAQRNAALISDAIAVLIEALKACDDIRYLFEGRY